MLKELPPLSLKVLHLCVKTFFSKYFKYFFKYLIHPGVIFIFYFKLDESTKPEWRSLYKTLLTKRTGDLQWRILHGAVVVNAFISVLNPEVALSFLF